MSINLRSFWKKNKFTCALMVTAFSCLAPIKIIEDYIGVDRLLSAVGNSDLTGLFIFVGLIVGLSSESFISRQFKAMVFTGGLLMATSHFFASLDIQVEKETEAFHALLPLFEKMILVFFVLGFVWVVVFSIWAMRRHIGEVAN